MMRRWVIALVVGALLAAGCGGAKKEESTLTLVQGAGSAVVAEKTAHAVMEFKTGGVSFDLTGQIDFVNERSSFQMDIPGAGVLDMVSDGTRLFVRTAASGWVLIEQTGALAEQAGQGFGADPRALLDQLADAEGVKDLGTKDIDGVSTTHYSGTLDFGKALKTSGAPDEQIAQVRAAAQGDLTATFDLYLDDNGLARRTVSKVQMGELGDITMTMNLVDFGKPVDITVPAASEITRTESASTQLELQQLMQSIFLGG